MISIQLKIIAVLVTALVVSNSNAQNTLWGTNNFVEYQVGTLPFVISVSHGGSLEPSSIPDRTCNNPVYVTDAFTIETALEMKNSLFALTGCYPHLIISHLKRTKLDPNRNLSDGACGNTDAMIAWNEFHDFITTARNTANQEYNNQTFFVDLHGHGNPIQRIELGYLLYDDELELPDNTLNTAQYVNFSSIQHLVANNSNNYTHVELLRGPYALGTLLTNHNFPSVPSQSIPSPGTTTNYFSGGYITLNHTCYDPAAPINGLQMELNFNDIRDTPENRTTFANAFSQSIVEYMNKHFGIAWNTCTPLSTLDMELDKNFEVYPNPAARGNLIHFVLSENTEYEYQIFDLLGQEVSHGELNSTKTLDTEPLFAGIYQILISNKEKTARMSQKIVIE